MNLNNSDLIILDEETTDVNYGWNYNNRPIDKLIKYGILYVDKPQGPTSHEVVAWVRKLLQINKAGHSGTLDPLVTGILPIGLEESTKVLSVLLLGSKEYHGVGRLHGPVNSKTLNLIVKEFTGEIYQKPPQKSAVKKVTRTRQIYDFQILEVKDNLFLFKVICESGTYIRKLIYDMGEILGVGATMAELRRSQVCHISESDSLLKIHDLVDAVYLSNHGGRQLDISASPLQILPDVRRELGPDFPILIDSGFYSGQDIVKALMLGADFVMVGRPFMIGLGALGHKGAFHTHDILKDEIENIMEQICSPNIEDIKKQKLSVTKDFSLKDIK